MRKSFGARAAACLPSGAAAACLCAAIFWMTRAPIWAATPASIYKLDSRRDLYEEKERERAEARAWSPAQKADSVAALFHADDVEIDGGAARLATRDYTTASFTVELAPNSFAQRRVELCDGKAGEERERFYGQPAGSFCTGFVVADGVMATASHCMATKTSDEKKCGNGGSTRFVFGFNLPENDSPAALERLKQVPASNVYACKEVWPNKGVQASTEEDIVLVLLDGKADKWKRPSLLLSPNAAMRVGEPLTVLGHPKGLSLKIADGEVWELPAEKGYFNASLDTHPGNSGSPVLDGRGAVVGVLTESTFKQGEDRDYQMQSRTGLPPCARSAVYPEPSKEHHSVVTKLSALFDQMRADPALPAWVQAAFPLAAHKSLARPKIKLPPLPGQPNWDGSRH